MGELVHAFEQDYWQQHSRNPSREKNYRAGYARPFSKLPQDRPLTPDLLKKALFEVSPDSRERLRRFQAYKKLAEFADIPVQLDRYRGNYKPGDRQPPSDEAIQEVLESLSDPRLRWLVAVGAIWGLRNHEVFFLDWAAASEYPHPVRVLMGKSGESFKPEFLEKGGPGARLAMPMVPTERDWLERWRPWELGEKPPFQLRRPLESYASGELGDHVSKLFSESKMPFAFYDLRRAWCVRCEQMGFGEANCCRWSGHTKDVSREHYTRIFPERDQIEMYLRLRESI